MQAKEITEAIKGYMECDDIGLQALVLYGDGVQVRLITASTILRPR